jgi:hypothetical protein
MGEKCESCKYWKPDACEPGSGVGECTRFPPKLSDLMMKQGLDSKDDIETVRWIATLFPITSDMDVCGEWKAR